MRNSNDIQISTASKSTTAEFAQWLLAYLNTANEAGVFLNSNIYPAIQNAVKKYYEALKKSVNHKKYHLALAVFSETLAGDSEANENGEFEDYFYDSVCSKFEQALLYPADLSRRENVKKAFLEAKKNEKAYTSLKGELEQKAAQEEHEKAWKKLETILQDLVTDKDYIVEKRRDAADRGLIHAICYDTITMDYITEPFILVKHSTGMHIDTELKVYQYNASYCTSLGCSISQKKPDSNGFTEGNMRLLPVLKEKLIAFYADYSADNNHADDTDNLARELREGAMAAHVEQNFQIPEPPARESWADVREPFADSATASGFYFGAGIGCAIGFMSYADIPGFFKLKDADLILTTTEGEAYIAALGIGMSFLLGNLAYLVSHSERNLRVTSGPVFKGQSLLFCTAACALTGVFTAKYTPGYTKPTFDKNGTSVDYTFTNDGALYITVLALSGFLLALIFQIMRYPAAAVPQPVTFRGTSASATQPLLNPANPGVN